MATGEWFGHFYARAYRGLLLTAHALLDDEAAAEQVTREAFAVAHRHRVRLAGEPDPEEWVRAVLVRLARRRLRWRVARGLLRRDKPAAPSARETALRLHRLAGLPAETIASIVDTSIETVESYLAAAAPLSWTVVRQPIVTRVVERARLRAARTRMLAVAAVAVLVVGVVVPLLRVESPEQAAAPSYPSTTPPPIVTPAMIYDLGFADWWHGYALRAECGDTACDVELLSTTDMEHWRARPVARSGMSSRSVGRLYVLGRRQVAVDVLAPNSGQVGRRLYSADSGRTWTTVPPGVHGAVRSIPSGASLEPACSGFIDQCDQTGIRVVLPDSGRSTRLVTAPRLDEAYPGAEPLANGMWWMAGLAPGTSRSTIAVSADDGRTWTVSRPPWRVDSRSVSWTVVMSGESLIATVSGQLEVDDYGILAIFRSDDGGRSWTKTRDQLPRGVVTAPIAASDGTLLVNTSDGEALVSRDLGRTFTETRPRFEGFAYWTRWGYVAMSGPDAPIRFSADGLHWRDLGLEW